VISTIASAAALTATALTVLSWRRSHTGQLQKVGDMRGISRDRASTESDQENASTESDPKDSKTPEPNQQTA
jgi:hypothetical protein